MASAVIATGSQRAFFVCVSCLGACYHRLACRVLSVTKQETESACGGNEAIKFNEGLKLQSAFVSPRSLAKSRGHTSENSNILMKMIKHKLDANESYYIFTYICFFIQF